MNNHQSKIEFIIDSQSSFVRLDKLLCLRFPELTRNKIVYLLEGGNITVNNRAVNKNYKPKPGDAVTIILPVACEYEVIPQDIPLDIIYEDDDIIVVNKPRGMVVHPAHGNESGTLVNALMYHCKDSLSGIGGTKRPGIVHRIDKDTSGLVVVAKNDKSHNALAAQFKDHSIQREYRAIVYGVVKADSGIVDKPVGRHKTNRKMMSCSPSLRSSKRAVTHYEVIERYNGFTYMKFNLETGRTHQIRVHMSDIGHFIIGDNVYGRKLDKIKPDGKGQYLHAKTLGFIHPATGEFAVFDSELPEYFQSALDKIKHL